MEPAEEHSHVVKAQPMPNFEKVFAPQYPQRMVTPQPFSFDKRDKNKKVLHKEEVLCIHTCVYFRLVVQKRFFF